MQMPIIHLFDSFKTKNNNNQMCDYYYFLFLDFSQLIDITGKDQDESMIALHDCNGDVNRAINVLLEGSPDTVSILFVIRGTAPEKSLSVLLYMVIKM